MRANRFAPVEEYSHTTTHTIEAHWTGRWPSRCFGKWVIRIDGEEVVLPDDKAKEPMYTEGRHATWYFDDNYEEQWEYYTDGLPFEEWIPENQWAVDLLPDEDDQRTLYSIIQAEDWRYGECGGCI